MRDQTPHAYASPSAVCTAEELLLADGERTLQLGEFEQVPRELRQPVAVQPGSLAGFQAAPRLGQRLKLVVRQVQLLQCLTQNTVPSATW